MQRVELGWGGVWRYWRDNRSMRWLRLVYLSIYLSIYLSLFELHHMTESIRFVCRYTENNVMFMED